jgi:glutamate-1-semialdehyde 2,1-aminomutase
MSDLLTRARKVIPNGVFGHRRSFVFVDGNNNAIPDDYPHFVRQASGCNFTDANGHRYIDYVCGYGAMLVGFANERVDVAATRQINQGLCYSFPSELEVGLAERLVAREQAASWAAFSLNGTDAISVAITTARAATGREGIAVAANAYHGTLGSTSLGPGRVQAERTATRTVRWGCIDSLTETLHAEAVAAVVLCPFEQLVGRPNTMPPEGYWRQVRQACDATGTVLILDDVRSGCRLHPLGSSSAFGIEPDLVCQSKAMANGYPIAATLGTERFRDAAQEIFVSGTFWGFAPALAAALATLDILDEHDGIAHMAAMGRRLTDGLRDLAQSHGFQLNISGPAALPMVLFEDDPQSKLAMEFARHIARSGSLVHPSHNWFLTLAHQQEDIDQTLQHAATAFSKMRQ